MVLCVTSCCILLCCFCFLCSYALAAALLPVELGTPQTGAVIIGRRNVYRLPPVGQDGLVTSISITMSSEGVQDTVACMYHGEWQCLRARFTALSLTL